MRLGPLTVQLGGWLLAATIIYLTAGSAATAPGIFPDEMCFLGWHRFLSGGDFYNMGAASYCHPLYPGLLATLQLFADTHAQGYRAAIALNAILAGACFPVASTIGRSHLNMSQAQAWCTGLIAVSYPAMIAYSRYAWPESALYLLTLLCLLAWCRLVDKPTRTRVAMLAVTVAALYFTHPRMLGFLVALTGAGLGWWAVQRDQNSRRIALCVVLFCLAIIAVASQIKSHVIPMGWLYDRLSPLNRLDSSLSEALAWTSAKAGGQILFALFATLGLGLLPMIWVVGARPKSPADIKFFLKVAAAPLLLLITAGISAVFLAGSERFDTFFYGRYIGPLIVANLVVGMSLPTTGEQRGMMTKAICIVALCLLAVTLFGPSDPSADYSRIHVLGASQIFDWLQPRAGSFAYHLFILLVAIAIAALTGFLSQRNWKWHSGIVLLAFALLNTIGESRRTVDITSYQPSAQLSARLGSPICEISWSSHIEDRLQNHQAFRIQYLYPACRFVFLESEQCNALPEGLLVAAAGSDECAARTIETFPLHPGLDVKLLRSAGAIAPTR